jgi:hypothetical protein
MSGPMTRPASGSKATGRSRRLEQMDLKSLFDSAIVFWSGTSGYAYVHTVYTLAGCPPLPPASVLLVDRQADGGRVILDVIGVGHTAPSLNLAEVRQRGAQLGANEVHVHFSELDVRARQTAVADLWTRYTGHHLTG